MLLPAISSPSGVLATPPVCTTSLMLQIPLLHAEKLCELPCTLQPLEPAGGGIQPIPFSVGLLSDGKWEMGGSERSQKFKDPFFSPMVCIPT